MECLTHTLLLSPTHSQGLSPNRCLPTGIGSARRHMFLSQSFTSDKYACVLRTIENAAGHPSSLPRDTRLTRICVAIPARNMPYQPSYFLIFQYSCIKSFPSYDPGSAPGGVRFHDPGTNPSDIGKHGASAFWRAFNVPPVTSISHWSVVTEEDTIVDIR